MKKLIWLAWKDNHKDKSRINFRDLYWRDFYYTFYLPREDDFKANGVVIDFNDHL